MLVYPEVPLNVYPKVPLNIISLLKWYWKFMKKKRYLGVDKHFHGEWHKTFLSKLPIKSLPLLPYITRMHNVLLEVDDIIYQK